LFSAQAGGPELSARNPVTYSAQSGELLAVGEALYRDDQLRLEAETIRYDRALNRVEAEGRVRLTAYGLRLAAQRVVYDVATRHIECGPFQAGRPPYHVTGDGFSGTLDQLAFVRLTAQLGEPGPFAPRLTAGTAQWQPDTRFAAQAVRLGVGGLPFAPLPRLTLNPDTPPPALELDIGHRASLGAFWRSQILVPIGESLAAGALFDGYSRRGVLAGPALDWQQQQLDRRYTVRLATGWIADQGDPLLRGVDRLGQPIDRGRGLLRAAFTLRSPGVEARGRLAWQSDSEVARDFRPRWYDADPEPDSYVEITGRYGDVLVSAFMRYPVNDYFGLTRKLPELRLEYLPTPLGATRWYADAALVFSHYRPALVANVSGAVFPDAPATPFFTDPQLGPALVDGPTVQRIDSWLRLQRPIALRPWLTLTPVATGRWTHYSRSLDRQRLVMDGAPLDRWMGELGADLQLHAHAVSSYTNTLWKIHGIRHQHRPYAQYRWYPGGGAQADSILPIESAHYSPLAPVLDLTANRTPDQLTDLHRLRVGWRYALYTRDAPGADAPIRQRLALHLAQDFDFAANTSGRAQHTSYLSAQFEPAPWLSAFIEQAVGTESLKGEAARVGLALRSADRWQLALFSEHIDARLEQYGADGLWQLSPRWAVLASLRYDALSERFSRQRYGVRHRVGQAWDVELYLSLRSGDQRESATSVGLRIHLLGF
jgi:LPS-assembly protein